MKAPGKLIDGDGPESAFARELLREARGEAMPAAAKAASWKSIAAQVPGALVAPTAAAAAGAAKGATAVAALKGALAVVALGGSIWGGHRLLTADSRRASDPSRPTPSAFSTTKEDRAEEATKTDKTDKTVKTDKTRRDVTSPASATVPETAPPASVSRQTPEAPGAPPPALAPSRNGTPLHEPARPSRPARAGAVPDQPGASDSVAPAESRLREESQLVLEAREGLRAGRASLVLRQLEEARARFPGGTLTQEREALTIEALWRSGQTAAARQRAEAFARTYPGSPHAARVHQLTSP